MSFIEHRKAQDIAMADAYTLSRDYEKLHQLLEITPIICVANYCDFGPVRDVFVLRKDGEGIRRDTEYFSHSGWDDFFKQAVAHDLAFIVPERLGV